ncbi:2557_t:CDS:2, partial [Cetraspora pellucida]
MQTFEDVWLRPIDVSSRQKCHNDVMAVTTIRGLRQLRQYGGYGSYDNTGVTAVRTIWRLWQLRQYGVTAEQQ